MLLTAVWAKELRACPWTSPVDFNSMPDSL